MTEAKTYKDTVNLPKTGFDMRANAVKREPELQKFWSDHQIYERLSQNNPGELFILHDGPPYANGSLHMGHALNKVLKDIINKYKLLRGHQVRYVPGWDCHGLPIELKVLQAMKSKERQNLTPLTLRQKAQKFALKTVEEQKESFKRYGIWGDWENPYLTLKPEYEAAQIGVFGKMVLNGYIYRGRKPVHWSPSSQTALAEAELEYPEGHTSRSIYAAFQITKLADTAAALKSYMKQLWVGIWTTTPWTIPGNLAVSVNPQLEYAVVETAVDYEPASGKFLIVAAELVDRLSETLGTTLTVKAKIKGKDLEGCEYKHPLCDRTSPVVIGGDYVTTESGTGLVHTAPGHGLEDYQVGQRYGLPILAPVDGNGNFTEEAGEFAGLNVLDEGNTAVIEALKKAKSLLKEEPYVHKYPYDWRTKKPTIFRATEQWFASVDGFRDEAMKAISEVKWIPAQGENRIAAMVSERSDWCISRQRSWGVPIPVFYEEETGEPLMTEETIAHVQAIIAEKGSDAWWELGIEDLLPEPYRSNGKTYRKGTDTMDVWFDSGSSWAAVVGGREELRYPADLYLEGSDQHRGWFQSSLLTSVANNSIAPYKSVLTHGFVLDENNRKMSKSLGNVVDPATIINGGSNQKQEPPYGADVLRLWVSSVDYSNDVPIGKNILKQLSDVYRKIRNTARFLLGNLEDFDPAKDAVPYEELPELDRYMLHRMTEIFAEVTDAFESYQFFRFFQTVQNFCVVDLSNFYLDIAKDRLYISAVDAKRRRSCQTVLAIALENLAKAVAPVLCHIAEDIWQNLPYPTPYNSVFEAGWVQVEDHWKQPELAKTWQTLRQLRGEVNQVLEKARQDKAVGSSLEAKVLLYVEDIQLRQTLGNLNPARSVGTVPTTTTVANPPEDPAKTVITTPKPAVTPPTPGEVPQWQQLLNAALAVMAELPRYLGVFFSDYRRPLLSVGLIVSATVSTLVLGAIVDAIADFPLLPGLLELIGIGYSGWFVNRYVLRANNRKELTDTIASVSNYVLGKTQTDAAIDAIEAFEDAMEEAIHPVTVPSPTPGVAVPPTIGNGVDELRYLFITSQVEVLDNPQPLEALKYTAQVNGWGIGVVDAEGQKCDRCWNYSTHVGESEEDPTICDRCVAALAGEF